MKKSATETKTAVPSTGSVGRRKSTYAVHVQLRLTAEQNAVYEALGQTEWLRRTLDVLPKLADEWNLELTDLSPVPENGKSARLTTPNGCLAVGIPSDEPTLMLAASLAEGGVLQTETEPVNILTRCTDQRAKAIAFEAVDDSLRDAGISKGDLMIIEKGEVPTGAVGLFNHGGELLARRLTRRGLAMELRTENSDEPTEPIKGNLMGTEHIGRVVSVIKKIR